MDVVVELKLLERVHILGVLGERDSVRDMSGVAAMQREIGVDIGEAREVVSDCRGDGGDGGVGGRG